MNKIDVKDDKILFNDRVIATIDSKVEPSVKDDFIRELLRLVDKEPFNFEPDGEYWL